MEPVREVVRDAVHDYVHPAGVRLVDQAAQVGDGPELRVDEPVGDRGVAVGLGAEERGRDPHHVEPERLDVVEVLGQPLEVAAEGPPPALLRRVAPGGVCC